MSKASTPSTPDRVRGIAPCGNRFPECQSRPSPTGSTSAPNGHPFYNGEAEADRRGWSRREVPAALRQDAGRAARAYGPNRSPQSSHAGRGRRGVEGSPVTVVKP